jgi:signal peptidase I
VIVFQFPQDPSKDFIKRCIAAGGQTLEVKDKQVVVDGEPLSEPYTIHTDPNVRPAGYDSRDNYGPLTVDAGEFFMMGDNRDNSNDSRYWGTLEKDLIKGRAMFLYWSWDGERHWPRWNRIFQAIH